jgi:membrane-associated phospholipid phosphatase
MRLSVPILRSIPLLVCVTLASPSRADLLRAGETDRVALDVPRDALVLTVGVLGAASPFAFRNRDATSCRWCDGAVGAPVNSVDDWFHAHLTANVFSRSTSDTVSSVVAFGLMPAIALGGTVFATGPHASEGAGFRNAVIVVESVAMSEALTGVIKYSVARQRPYLHYRTVDMHAASSDATLSFPSGHTSLVAAAGTSAAMLATLEESPAAPWLWGAAGALTVFTGTLRMSAESHYFTDVVGGALLGASTGIALPLLHRRGSLLGGSIAPSFAATDGGAMLGMSGAF